MKSSEELTSYLNALSETDGEAVYELITRHAFCTKEFTEHRRFKHVNSWNGGDSEGPLFATPLAVLSGLTGQWSPTCTVDGVTVKDWDFLYCLEFGPVVWRYHNKNSESDTDETPAAWPSVSPQEAVDYLNDLLRIDSRATTELFSYRIETSERDGKPYQIGVLEILNGFFNDASIQEVWSDGELLEFTQQD